MDPLFKDQEDYDRFCARHASNQVKSGDLSSYEGCCYLGIDAGSTTTKAALVGEDGTLLYRFYDNNNGSPLATAIRAIREIKEQLPETARIAYSCSTGYGEAVKGSLMWMRERWRPYPTTMRLLSLSRMWTVSWTSADRI